MNPRTLLLSALGVAALLAACSVPPAAPAPAATPVPAATTAPAAPSATSASPSPSTQSPAPALPEGAETLDGVPVGFTEDGYPYRGRPDAPVQIHEFSDYLCPFCARHVEQTYPSLLEDFVQTGKAVYVFRDFPIAALHPTAPVGHQAAWCAGEQGASLYWRMHDALFAGQQQWSSLPDPTTYLAGVAERLGAGVTAYNECMATGRTMARVDAGVAEAQARGYNGTPSFEFVRTAGGETYPLVGAQPLAQFNAVLGPLAAGEVLPTPSPEPTPVPPELPFWAVPEGLAADPARPGFTMAGDPYRGDPASRFAVVEFSDFQCPACRTHAVDVEPELRKQLVEAGMVQWVYKDLPLAMHPQAALAAAAAQCAGEQGKFWEMHDRLFAEQERWAVDPPDPVLRQLAAGVGLDAGAFSACLDGRGALEAVLDDIYAAQSVPVTSTPTFIFFDRKNGVIIRGSRPAKDFVEVLQGLIRTADPTPASGG